MINLLCDKRGEGFTLIGIVIAVVVLGVAAFIVVSLFAGTAGDVERGIETFNDVQAFTTAICAVAAETGDSASTSTFCLQFRELEGGDDYINCQDIQVENILVSQGLIPLSCNSRDVINNMREICSEAKPNDKDDITINGRTCIWWEENNWPEDEISGRFDQGENAVGATCESLGGQWESEMCLGPTFQDVTSSVADKGSQPQGSPYCCATTLLS